MNGTGVSQWLPAGMDTRYTLCGRTALELVLRDILREQKVKKVYMPSYCCHTMIEPFVIKGIEPVFYDVFFTDTGIDFDFDENTDCQLVFLMDYFGFPRDKTMEVAHSQKAMGKTVIYDATHTVFCEAMDYSACDYVFGSFRKWFGVNAGFCAKGGTWTCFPALSQNKTYTRMRNAAFSDKACFMAGQAVEKSVFLDGFSRAEAYLETDYVGYAPDGDSMRVLEAVDVDVLRRKRRENGASVINEICRMQSSSVHSPFKQVGRRDCPLFVPLQVTKELRKELRGMLIQNQVYLPVHWPLSDLHSAKGVSGEIYDTELSFVCDQRYGMEDMDRAIQRIRSF